MKWLIFWTADKDMKVKMIIAVEQTTSTVVYSTKVSQLPSAFLLAWLVERCVRSSQRSGPGSIPGQTLNFLGSFLTSKVVYSTARIISTFIQYVWFTFAYFWESSREILYVHNLFKVIVKLMSGSKLVFNNNLTWTFLNKWKQLRNEELTMYVDRYFYYSGQT